MKSAFFRILLLVSVNLAILIVLLEIGGNLFFALENGRFFYGRQRPKIDSTPATNPFMSGDVRIVLHPYFGFMYKPNVSEHKYYLKFNNHGFVFHPEYVRQHPGCCDYPSARREDDVIVGVFGGSVAGQLATRVQENTALREALSTIPRFAGKRIRILPFALGGHKQPQQLMILTYYLSLGQPLDVVINVDGWNEIATGNWHDMDISYPDRGHWRRVVDFLERQAAPAHSPESLLENYHLMMAQRWARRAANCRIATCYNLARLVRYWHQTSVSSEVVSAHATPTDPFLFRLFPPVATALSNIDLRVHRWAEASELMQQLARGRNILYLHAVQPSPWFRRTTPFKARGQDLEPTSIKTTFTSYLALLAKGEKLRELGVNFLDASAVLDNEPNTIYSDDAGHYVPKAYDMLWLAIVQALAAPDIR